MITIVTMFTVIAVNHNCCKPITIVTKHHNCRNYNHNCRNLINHKCHNCNHTCRNFYKKIIWAFSTSEILFTILSSFCPTKFPKFILIAKNAIHIFLCKAYCFTPILLFPRKRETFQK